MTDMLIDKTNSNKRHTLHRCFYCKGHEKLGKVIMPYDKHARKTDKGDYMCGICTLEMSQRIFDGMNRRGIVQ